MHEHPSAFGELPGWGSPEGHRSCYTAHCWGGGGGRLWMWVWVWVWVGVWAGVWVWVCVEWALPQGRHDFKVQAKRGGREGDEAHRICGKHGGVEEGQGRGGGPQLSMQCLRACHRKARHDGPHQLHHWCQPACERMHPVALYPPPTVQSLPSNRATFEPHPQAGLALPRLLQRYCSSPADAGLTRERRTTFDVSKLECHHKAILAQPSESGRVRGRACLQHLRVYASKSYPLGSILHKYTYKTTLTHCSQHTWHRLDAH